MPKHDVAVVGIGQTKFRSKRRDVNIPEMIYEAVKMALDYLGIKTKKEIKVELVREFKKNVFAWYCPAWKITVGKKVVCVAQDGRIYTDELPGQGRGMEPQRKKK